VVVGARLVDAGFLEVGHYPDGLNAGVGVSGAPQSPILLRHEFST
jgi:hypothetical protein